ncbi:hypothetical protein Tco_0090317 [Tanacetum coccineum]
MAESAKRHEENSNIIKEIRASTDSAIRNQGASIKTLEIQIGQIPFPNRLHGYCCDWMEAHEVNILETYDHTLPQKEKDPKSFNLPCFIHNVCFDKALVDLGDNADRWRPDELAYGVPSNGPYKTNPHSIEDIISSIRIDLEGQVCHIRHEEEIDVLEYQVLTHEIEPTLKPLEEIIQENVFCLGGNRDHDSRSHCYYSFYFIELSTPEKFNLAYYMAKQMEWVTKQARLLLPYGMLLTRLFTFIMNENPELNNESYVLYDHVMTPLAAQLE